MSVMMKPEHELGHLSLLLTVLREGQSVNRSLVFLAKFVSQQSLSFLGLQACIVMPVTFYMPMLFYVDAGNSNLCP